MATWAHIYTCVCIMYISMLFLLSGDMGDYMGPYIYTCVCIMYISMLFLLSGDMGGYMGLLLGASVMTLWELIDFLCHNMIRKCKSKATTQPQHSPVVAFTPDNEKQF